MSRFSDQEGRDVLFTEPHLSHAQIDRYLLCPEQYRLYYVEGLRPRMLPASLVFGKGIHQALAYFFRTNGCPVTWFHKAWEDVRHLPMRYGSRESWEKLALTGQALLATFVEQDAPKLANIRKVEHPFSLTISGLDLPLVGVIDLVAELDGTPTVVDFKTAGSGYDGHEATMSDQLSAYRLAEPGVSHAALCVLVKLKEPRIEWHVTERGAPQLMEYLAKVGYVAREIAAGHFYKRPGKWCAWCDFLPVCLGDVRRSEETLVKAA